MIDTNVCLLKTFQVEHVAILDTKGGADKFGFSPWYKIRADREKNTVDKQNFCVTYKVWYFAQALRALAS